MANGNNGKSSSIIGGISIMGFVGLFVLFGHLATPLKAADLQLQKDNLRLEKQCERVEKDAEKNREELAGDITEIREDVGKIKDGMNDMQLQQSKKFGEILLLLEKRLPSEKKVYRSEDLI